MSELSISGRILYVSSVDISIGNGPGVNEREFVLALYRSIGDRAHFLIPKPVDNVTELPLSAGTFSLPHKEHSLRHFPNHVISTIRLANHVLSTRTYDLVVFRLDLMPIAPLCISRRHHVPFVLKTLGQGQMNTLVEKISWPLGPVLAEINKLMVGRLAHDAIAVDTVSELQREYLGERLKLGLEKIFVVDNAVNTRRFFPASKEIARRELGLIQFDPIIGYIGNHAALNRGGKQLILAARDLLQKYPKLGVLILGDLSGSESLIDLAQQHNLQDHCLFTGYVPFERVPIYINALDVGVSLLAPRYRGQSELKVRQYLACGKPVVATTPGRNDFLAEQRLGSLVRSDDQDEICVELDRWLSLGADDQLEFASRAAQYARDQLSVERSLAMRMNLWNERLAELHGAPAIGHQMSFNK